MPRRGSTPPLPATYRHEASDQSKPHPTSKSRMQFPRRPHARQRENSRISTVRVQNLKCPEGNCMRNWSPLMSGRHKDCGRTYTLTVSAFNSTSTAKLSPHAFLAISPVRNSPNRPPSAALPRQNSPCSPKMTHFSGFWPCRASFVSPRRQALDCWANFRTQQRWTNDHPRTGCRSSR